MISKTLILACFFAGIVSAASRGRTLGAATSRSSLDARNEPCQLSNNVDLVYADYSNDAGATAYGAKVRVLSDRPILVLEEMEDWVSALECSSSTIILSKHAAAASEVFDNLHGLVGGHVITSHSGCNAEHERLPYRVVAVEDNTPDTVSLSVIPATWKDSFKSIKVQFGYTTEGHELRAHSEVRRRLQARQSDPTDVVNAVPTLTAPTPSDLPDSDNTTGSVDLSASLTNKPIPLPSEIPIQLTCLDCRTFGSIDYSFGDFSIDHDLDITGTATVTAQGFGAHVNISAELKQSDNFLTPLIPGLALDSGIHIPGLGKASLTIGPFIAGGYDYNGSLAITSYGFDMRVPDGSQLVLDVGNFSNSDITGLSDTTVTALPLNAEVEISTLNAWLALRSTIAASFEVDVDIASAAGGAGVYVDTPIIIVNATNVTGVGANCEPMDKGLDHAIDIDYITSWNFGAYIYANATLLGDDSSWDPKPYYSNGDPKPLPKQCLGFADNQYINASVALQNMQAAENMASRPESAGFRAAQPILGVCVGVLGAVAVVMLWL
ncbi:hypothetical protein PRZ48_010935 [Zasmidium cellare]|uniref:Uncharacterized protein n=1 Tax=Zasmidium cellare TaxID=395010 RepID=A0ABR0EA11_ZASCE|nr:hypothetical protein PRZ48_010935 [Zasmidium cellare]